MGYCIYDRCPYWHAAAQVCDADCLKNQEPAASALSDWPCTIEWTEDFD